MINVKDNEDGSFTVEWDENDEDESFFNNWTKEDFTRFFRICAERENAENLEKNLKSLASTKVRKTRIDKKPVFTKVKSGDLWELGNGNGNIKNTMPWYLHPVIKDTFNRSWFRDYDDACKQIARLKLRPEQYTLTKYNG